MKRKLRSEFWGDEKNPDRKAEIYHNQIYDHFEVDFYNKDELKETRDMKTDGVIHSLRYAEDAAENWCLGYIP